MPMKFDPLTIDGAYKISPKLLQDGRGSFARVFCSDLFSAQGLNCHWKQMNVSRTAQAGTVRGMHFQRLPFCEIKLVRCVAGLILDVIVDLRKGSASFGQVCAVELCADKMEMLYVPAGCAHGFQTLSDDVELHYLHSQDYRPDHEGGLLPTDPELAIAWPRAISNLSERDQKHPLFKQVEPIIL